MNRRRFLGLLPAVPLAVATLPAAAARTTPSLEFWRTYDCGAWRTVMDPTARHGSCFGPPPVERVAKDLRAGSAVGQALSRRFAPPPVASEV